MQADQGTGIGQYTMHLYKNLKENSVAVELDKYVTKSRGFKKYFNYLKYINSNNYINHLKDFDVIHYTSFHMPFRKIRNSKTIVTVHDLAFNIHPETMPKSAVLFSKLMMLNTFSKADTILTVSYSVYNEIKKYYPKYIYKVKVIYPGIYQNINTNLKLNSFINKSLNDLNDFFLYVGTIEYRKNIGIIIDAFIKLKENNLLASDYKLVLAGKMGYGSDSFLRIANESQFKNDIIFSGFINNNDCNLLYRKAKAYIFPTCYEGFGSTQLECMENHLPLILSNIKTNIEVSSGYGLFFDLSDLDSLVDQMSKIVSGDYDYAENNRMADTIINKFQWPVLIRSYIACYKNLCHEE